MAPATWSEAGNTRFTRVEDGDGYSDNAALLFGGYAPRIELLPGVGGRDHTGLNWA